MRLILEIASSVANGQEIKKIWEQKAIDEEILIQTDRNILKVLVTLFPSGIPVDHRFYDALASLQHFIGFKETSQSLLANIWRIAFNKVSRDDQIQLLQSLLIGDNRAFWMGVRLLPAFLPEVKIEPEYLSSWLVSMAGKVQQDLAGGPFYNAIQQHACKNPRTAFIVLEKYISEGLAEPKLTISAIILGSIRSVEGTRKISKLHVKKLERELMNSPVLELRVCNHRSLAVSFNLGAISTEYIQSKLNQMLCGLPEEVGEAFSIVYNCLVGNPENSSYVRLFFKWLEENIDATIPDIAKHYVMCTVNYLSDKEKRSLGGIDVSSLNLLVSVVQPIPEENQGTWSRIEEYLVDRLHEGQDTFGIILDKLANVNAKGLSAQFSGNRLRHLVSEMSKYTVEEPMTKLIISPNRHIRRLAITILQRLEKVKLSPKILKTANEVQLKTILLELTSTFLVEKGVVEFLLGVEPYFSRTSKELQERFISEVTFQAINYPHSCLSILKEIQKPSKLIRGAIDGAESYFSRLKTIYDSPAVSFHFPRFQEMEEMGKRSLTEQVSKGIEEQSVLLSFVKHIQIIYGSTWSNLIDATLSNDTKFSEFHEDMEFPRLESIDPEGMKIRRLRAALELKQLEVQD